MALSIVLIVVASLLLLIGFIGTFVPVIPGAPLAWLGLLAAYFCQYSDVSILMLIITAVLAVVVSIMDNIFPIIMTKNFGGSKAATTGSTIGLIIGLFCGTGGNNHRPVCRRILWRTDPQPRKLRRRIKGSFWRFCRLSHRHRNQNGVRWLFYLVFYS